MGDWRGKTFSRLRDLIKQAAPEVVEEWKWRKPSNPGVPVWSDQGGICTGETYKSVVKLTFFKGASLKEPSGLFNSSLEGNVRRAIDFHEGDEIDEKAFMAEPARDPPRRDKKRRVGLGALITTAIVVVGVQSLTGSCTLQTCSSRSLHQNGTAS